MRYAIITGTSRGIGKALALRYLELGYRVIGIARTSTIKHDHFSSFAFDLMQPIEKKDWLAPLAEAEEVVFIHNAGMLGEVGRFSQGKQHDYQQVFQLNVFAGMALVADLLEAVAPKIPLKIAFISSGAGRRSIPSWSAYCASKAAVDRWLSVLAEEEKELGHVNRSFWSIAPGVVDTAMQEQIRSVSSEHFSSSERFIALKSNQELVSPEKVASAIDELLSTNELGEVIVSLKLS